MGITVGQAIAALLLKDIRVQRGYPGKLMPHLTGPVVAVNVLKKEPDKTTLVAEVCAPMTKGLYACEDLAAKVAEYWTAEGGICSYGDKGFDSKSGLYFLRVQGAWPEQGETTTETEAT